MDDAQIEQFAQRLQALRVELLASEQATKDETRPVELDQASVGRLSRMDAMQVQEMAQETARRRRQQLGRVEAALRRIEAGDFGYCFVCGEEIDPRRLAVDPTHTRCVACVERGD